MRLAIIDNYDSFTFNLFQLAAEFVPEPLVIRNDAMSWEEFERLEMDCVVISPGPGRPDRASDFGICARIIAESALPILGVCLGHQGIYHTFGGPVRHAPEPMHGRTSSIYHEGVDLFAGVPNPFLAVRYHSLVCADPLPPVLRRTAWTSDGLTMAVAHRDKPIWGVQFHPESISTEYGRLILSNFINMAASRRREVLPRTASQTCSESKAPAAPCFSSPVRREAGRKVFVRRLHSSLKSEDVFQTLFGGAEIAIWLDSAKTTDLGCGRFSIMTGGKRSSFEIIQYDASSQAIVSRRNDKAEQTSGDLFTYLKRRIADDRLNEDDLPFSFACGFIGFVGYEMKGCCGSRLIHHSEFPDALFVYVDRCIVIDHSKGDIYLLYLEYGDNGSRVETWFAQMIDSLGNIKTAPAICDTNTISFTACQNRDKYLQRIASCLQYIRDGESYEICLTNRLTAATEVEPLAYYFGLRSLNPAPFGAFLRLPAVSIACSSPERFLSVTADGVVETKPIKGTCRRGRTPDEDEALRQFLSSDIKSRAENLMIVDLLRNDLGRSCEPGTVTVPKLMHVETFATVHQLVTTVRGQLRDAMTAVDCLRLAFPGGSMTGAPKVRTMEIIDQLECHARGVYSGCIGYFSLNGSADFNIVIRTAVFSDKKVSIGVGGAITAMSDPSQEWDEIILKGEVLLRAFGDCKVR